MRRRTAPAPRQMPSGNWQVRVRDPLTNRLITLGSFASRDLAERAQVLAMADQERGAWRPPNAAKQTFATWADRYLATTSHLRPKTRANYESTLRRHLLPALGPVELRRLPLHARDRVRVGARERPLAGEHLEVRHAQRVQVRAAVGALAGEQLGRDVA